MLIMRTKVNGRSMIVQRLNEHLAKCNDNYVISDERVIIVEPIILANRDGMVVIMDDSIIVNGKHHAMYFFQGGDRPIILVSNSTRQELIINLHTGIFYALNWFTNRASEQHSFDTACCLSEMAMLTMHQFLDRASFSLDDLTLEGFISSVKELEEAIPDHNLHTSP